MELCFPRISFVKTELVSKADSVSIIKANVMFDTGAHCNYTDRVCSQQSHHSQLRQQWVK
jgi:hypothetical protein